MLIGALNFCPVDEGAGGNSDIRRRNRSPRLATHPGEAAGLDPDRLIDIKHGQFLPETGNVTLIFFGPRAHPQLDLYQWAETCVSGFEQFPDALFDRRIALFSEEVNPTRCINERHEQPEFLVIGDGPIRRTS